MGDASYIRDNFHGGEWSQFAQGNVTSPIYRQAMNVCLNGYPLEEGAWTRRTGGFSGGFTRLGFAGVIRSYEISDELPYLLEFTPGYLRLWSTANGAPQLVMAPETQIVSSISAADPAVVTTQGSLPSTWVTGSNVTFGQDITNNGVGAATFFGRVFTITVLTSDTFSIADPITGLPIDGSTITQNGNMVVNRVLEFATPYTAANLQSIRVVQTGAQNGTLTAVQAVVLCPGQSPYVLTPGNPQNSPCFATFTYAQWSPQDGPYFDPPQTGAYLVASGTSGVITLTVAYVTYSSTTTYAQGQFVTAGGLDYVSLVNNNLNNTPASSPSDWEAITAGTSVGPNGFVSTDVGRMMRLFSQPPVWAVGTGYSTGTPVIYNGLPYTAVQGNTGKEPDLNPLYWAVAPTAQQWTWGIITGIVSSTEVNFQIIGNNSPGFTVDNLLYSGGGNPIQIWQMGLYSATTGYPTCGAYHEGRLWLGGLIPNRVDGSMSNDPFYFSLSANDGTVADNNALALEIESEDVANVAWFQAYSGGMVLGTENGEWVLAASTLDEPITPTSVQVRRKSKYRCANIEPINTGFAIGFVQKFQRQLLEYMVDVFSQRYAAHNLAHYADHIAGVGIAEIRYQSELIPIIWMRGNDGSLFGTTYRRESAFMSEQPIFNGWHRHQLGSGRSVVSIATGPSVGGNFETLFMVTQDPATKLCYVDCLANAPQVTDTVYSAWYVDAGIIPTFASYDGSANVTFYGLQPVNGKTITVWGLGQDLGDYVVSGGSITVPVTSAQAALMASLTGTAGYGGLNTWVNYSAPLQQPNGLTSMIPSSTVLGSISSGPFIPNWDKDNAIFFSQGSASNNGVRQMKIYEPNTKVVEAANSTIFNGLTFYTYTIGKFALTPSVLAPFAQDASGNIFFPISNSNASTIAKVNKNLAVAGWWGRDTSTLTGGTGSLGMLNPYSFASVYANANYLVSASSGQVGGKAEITVLNSDNFTYGGSGDSTFSPTNVFVSKNDLTTQQRAVLVAGPQVNDRYNQFSKAVVYGLGKTSAGGSSTVSLELFSMTIAVNGTLPTTTFADIANIAPSAIDATWTHFTAVTGMIWDQTDGNLIFEVNTGDSVTNTHYLVKVNSGTGAVVWVSALPNGATYFSDACMPLNRIKYGLLVFGTSTTVYFVNTSTGMFTTTTAHGCGIGASSAFDDTTGLLMTYQSYTAPGGGAWPQPLGTSTSSFTNWSTIDEPAMIAGPLMTGQSYTVPFSLGFNYTSQGQLTRAIAPEEAGARNGPALAKTRRQHMAGLLLVNAPPYTFAPGTQNAVFQWGTKFTGVDTTLYPVIPKQANGQYVTSGLVSGVHWDTLQDDYTFDSMLCWQINRPWPCTIAAVEGFIHTQDR